MHESSSIMTYFEGKVLQKNRKIKKIVKAYNYRTIYHSQLCVLTILMDGFFRSIGKGIIMYF